MRHQVDERKLGRTSPHRKALFANLATSLILNDRIETTLPKAKELRRIADRLVTMGKNGSLHARRRAISLIRDKNAVHKLFDELAKRFATRNGGYTRIYKLGHRHGDAASMAAIEYLPSEKHAHTHGDETHAAKEHAPKKTVHEKKAHAAKPAKKHTVKKAAAKPAKKKTK